MVPRKIPYHHEEGLGGPLLDRPQPRVASLRDARLTIRSDGESTRDNWRLLACDRLEEPWTGRCTFYDRWSEASEDHEAEVAVVAKTGSLGDLVFHDETGFYPMDDLFGERLGPELTIAAKREEVIEMYMRSAWLERWVQDCYRGIGKPPMPVRWAKPTRETGAIRR